MSDKPELTPIHQGRLANIDWRLKPCPDRMRGEPCDLCGCVYVCGQTKRPKPYEMMHKPAKEQPWR